MCGINLNVNIPQLQESGKVEALASHQLVLDSLHIAGDYEHRAGYNIATKKSDGVGIRCFGLPTAFIQRTISEGQFKTLLAEEPVTDLVLEDKKYGIGRYFLGGGFEQIYFSKKLIEDTARAKGLKVVGWRHLNQQVNPAALSKEANQETPSMWDALLVPEPEIELLNLEHTMLTTGLAIINAANRGQIDIDMVSHSSESWVFKGMIPPRNLGAYFPDLLAPDFTATATSIHDRDATNTKPKFSRAQPCWFAFAHNGELNSAGANAVDMTAELIETGFEGGYPSSKLSDSMQFDMDLANTVARKKITIYEAFARLMPPPISKKYSPEVNAMLNYFRLERTPYNGPAFAAAGYEGYYLIKLDDVGLRPSRYAIVENKEGNRQFISGSEDTVIMSPDSKLIKKGHLAPGGMMVITPEGDVLNTEAVLNCISDAYNSDIAEKNYFQQAMQKHLHPMTETLTSLLPPVKETHELHRLLFSGFVNHEDVADVIAYMAKNGKERQGAMGNDVNPLYSENMPVHISYFFHQLGAQITAPSIDSIRERMRFTLTTTLGEAPHSSEQWKQIQLISPILGLNDLLAIEQQPHVHVSTAPMIFDPQHTDLEGALIDLLQEIDRIIEQQPQGGILILSDSNANENSAMIPDMLAVAAVRRHLEERGILRKFSIIADSYQITGPHQAAALLAVGAKAVYTRGAYEKIRDMHRENDQEQIEGCCNYKTAQELSLLKIMGKMGITDVANYSNGRLLSGLGINLTLNGEETDLSVAKKPTLAKMFKGMYSPLKGFNLKHINNNVVRRHDQAYDTANDFIVLPRSGFFMPEKDGLKHGFGPEVVNAFTQFFESERIRRIRFRLHNLLAKLGFPNYLSPKELEQYKAASGYLDPHQKIEGRYSLEYLEQFQPSSDFKTMSLAIHAYQTENPTSLHDNFMIDSNKLDSFQEQLQSSHTRPPLQSQADIRNRLSTGSMSLGALTIPAWNSIIGGANAVGVRSASGEGGEDAEKLRNPFTTATNKQIASGRFGVSATQIKKAKRVEIKAGQGAKGFEGGELSGLKIDIEFAAQRGSLPGINLISPPPHHDIYSIEDLKQLIRDIKSLNPDAEVCVKLVASEGIGTIAVGCAKEGADIINIAGNSGGTGSAAQSSRHTGLPAEVAIAEVDYALREAGYRDFVKIQSSGGFKTAEDIIIATILGLDEYELGTTAMIAAGCEMERTCNLQCSKGVATNAELFKSDQLDIESYLVNLGASIQQRLIHLGVRSLDELRGRTELLSLVNPELEKIYDFSLLLDKSKHTKPLSTEKLAEIAAIRQSHLLRAKEAAIIQQIESTFAQAVAENNPLIFESELIELTNQDLSFGARIAGHFVTYLEKHPDAKIILNTQGIAGQSFGFVMPAGMSIHHTGTVNDGFGKSQTGGTFVIKTPNQNANYRATDNTVGGNAGLYGASGGHIYIDGVVGHRFAILMKGAEVVVEGVGDLAFEYMTDGTGMILGQVGEGLGVGASAGILFVYDKDNTLEIPLNMRYATSLEVEGYTQAMRTMLEDHKNNTESLTATQILEHFDPSQFKIVIPKELDNIKTFVQLMKIIATYNCRATPISQGMKVWLTQKTKHLLDNLNAPLSGNEIKQLKRALKKTRDTTTLPKELFERLTQLLPQQPLTDIEDLAGKAPAPAKAKKLISTTLPLLERLNGITGIRDEHILPALKHLIVYASQLKNDATGCPSCREQSCSGSTEIDTGCSMGKPIQTINATLKELGDISADNLLTSKQWRILRQAVQLQFANSPFPFTGDVCPAPCEQNCSDGASLQTGELDPKKANKPVGEPVHIKSIEHDLFVIADALGWLDGNKTWSQEEITAVFGTDHNKLKYDRLMEQFTPFFKAYDGPPMNKEIVIVGSGPAAIQIAYEALKDGFKVRMYEKSDKPGGLLTDGIPAYKFHKEKIEKSFDMLISMGLELHCSSEIVYNKREKQYQLQNGVTIAHSDNPDQQIVLCVGAGKPKSLPEKITATLDAVTRQKKILQAVDFLKVVNDIAAHLEKNPALPITDKEQFILHQFIEKLGVDPRCKKIGVIGGGDTAQDVIRWLARYFKEYSGQLNILVRGPKPESQSLSKENQLRNEEVEYIQGDVSHLVEPVAITSDSHGKLSITRKISRFKCYDTINQHQELSDLFKQLPREAKPLDEKTTTETVEGFDLIICALGFESADTIPLVASIPKEDREHIVFAGDASGSEKIIVSAQANADRTYQKKIKGSALSSPTDSPFALFERPKAKIHHPHTPPPIAMGCS